MRRLGRAVARPPHLALHALDETVALPHLLELLGGKPQPRRFDEDGEALRLKSVRRS